MMPPWAVMWVTAFALYAGCKWLTYRDARARGLAGEPRRALAYLVAWPGMDAPAFLDPARRVSPPGAREWTGATINVVTGILLIWVVSPLLRHSTPLAAGWVGMAGAVFVLHFGTFHWIALGWRSYGADAVPVMRHPLRSTSLAEFWGRRWNTAFHELARRFTFTPLRTRIGVPAATLLAFFMSGLIHELVISVPARTGYGLPTAYFVVQGGAVLLERSPLGRWIGLARGWRGWAFTVAVTAGPAFWLFPPSFVRVVILPMLDVIGASVIHQEFVMRIDLTVLLHIAGLMHLGLICAGVMMPRVVDMRTHLATLPPFLRQLFWVYYAFIGLCLIGFSTITIVFAETLAHGGTLARAVCAFLAVFWALRLYVATFVFDLRPYLTSGPRRLGYAATNVVFAFLPVVYLLAAIMPAV